MTKEIKKLLENRNYGQINQENREIVALDYIIERLEKEALNTNREEYLNRLERISSLLSDMEKENISVSCFVEEDGKLFVPNKEGKLIEVEEQEEDDEEDIKDLPF